jgi:hypothetical protein
MLAYGMHLLQTVPGLAGRRSKIAVYSSHRHSGGRICVLPRMPKDESPFLPYFKLRAARHRARLKNPDYKEGRKFFGDRPGESETHIPNHRTAGCWHEPVCYLRYLDGGGQEDPI